MMHLVDLIGIYNDFYLMAVITILCPSESEGCKLLNIPTFSKSHLVAKKFTPLCPVDSVYFVLLATLY